MGRLFVISDIHGCLDHFNALLDQINYQPNVDKIILLGDYLDRGPKSKEVVEKVLYMFENEDVIAIRGNHDQRFVELIETKNPKTYKEFLEFGGLETLESYCPDLVNQPINKIAEFISNEFATHIEFLKSIPLYYEDPYFIFVHAGLNPKVKNWKEQSLTDFIFIRDPFIYNETLTDKVVVFGHTKTTDIHNSSGIWFSKDKIGIDGGCAYGLQLNCLEILNGKDFKEHHVQYNSI